MNCICCDSAEINQNLIESDKYYSCNNCGLLFLECYNSEETIDSLRNHYRNDDPYDSVSHSKKIFYTFVLDYLSSRVHLRGKKILDVGCGFGYFLDMASKKGWDVNGIEVMQDAVKCCGEKFGNENVFQGKIKKACLSGKYFDAITLWDVIAIVDDPFNELEECNRLLKKGGIIGIRTRNVLFQTFVYRLFNLIRQIASRYGMKEPYVFNRFCFSSKSIYTLLKRTGFINIRISNSPLTSGDPYDHMGFQFPINLAKYFLNIISKLIFWISRGRLLIGPSLLIWAEKP
jgi:ubiquinone/menaquinone biosynthesis C-methylase UbiE